MRKKIDRTKGRNRQLKIAFGDFNTSLSVIKRMTTQNIDKEKEDLNNTQLTQPNRHLQNTPPNKSSMCILLKCTWNMLQNRPYIRA